MDEILELTAAEAGRRIAAGEVSGEECHEAWAGAAAGDELNAYLCRVDGRRSSEARYPPAAVKDIFCTEGVTTTAGSRILEGYVPPYTATAVRRLAEVGVHVLGKTNMDE